jgi:hypothetical protein
MIRFFSFSRRAVSSGSPAGETFLWWSFAAVLLTFLCCSHFFVLLSFVAGRTITAEVAPAAFVVAILVVDGFLRKGGMLPRQRTSVYLLAGGVIAGACLLAGAFYDMSWDGLWYHQTAVYQMAHGWNPLRDPLHEFTPHLQDWVRHYAKGPWYTALTLYATTGSIEMAKAAPWIALVATFAVVYALVRDLGLARYASVAIAFLVACNPVTVFELPSYLVDGLMISYLACMMAAMIQWFRKPAPLMVWFMLMSGILCINAKQTGLVYLCFAIAAGGVYVIMQRRDLLGRFVAFHAIVLLIGTIGFGYNPYVTNTIYRGHPFYPMLGTQQYPSLAMQGEDPIEKWETPHNMMGRNRFYRLGYALFGRPTAAPYFPGENAELMVPGNVGPADFALYYFHDVRIAGFGPLFSVAFSLAMALLVIALIRGTVPRAVLIIAAGAIIASLLVSEHTWWARYGPQLWWLPLIALFAGLVPDAGRPARLLAWTLGIVLIVNLVPIAAVHFWWEADATCTTNQQMQMLRGKEGIEADMQYFGEPFGERMKQAGVSFTPVPRLPCGSPMELMSVSPGYPCAVRVCFK